MKDDFGNRMKDYERHETGRKFIPLLPVYARIDGRSFSAFTKGLNRPYDRRLANLMIETTRYLVQETNAVMGYTQSDEISLAWFSHSVDSQIFFDGKIFKMTSVLAAMATAYFNKHLAEYLPEKSDNMPVFDCRVFQLPNCVETANAFLWREQDATKNAISMAARHYFPHNKLHGKSGKEMQEMLWKECNINFNDYPAFFKRGTFLQRQLVYKELPPEILNKIPEEHRPTGPIERQIVVKIEMPRFSQVKNRVNVIFNGANPEVDSD